MGGFEGVGVGGSVEGREGGREGGRECGVNGLGEAGGGDGREGINIVLLLQYLCDNINEGYNHTVIN